MSSSFVDKVVQKGVLAQAEKRQGIRSTLTALDREVTRALDDYGRRHSQMRLEIQDEEVEEDVALSEDEDSDETPKKKTRKKKKKVRPPVWSLVPWCIEQRKRFIAAPGALVPPVPH